MIIGTLFKEQKKKPCILQNITGVIEPCQPIDMSLGTLEQGVFVSEDDVCILEDSSGRITIKESPNFRIAEQVTGTIMALLGMAD